MIVKLINEEKLWIPTPKLFFKILNEAGLETYSASDNEIIEKKLTEAVKKDYSGWTFAIKFAFNIKDGDFCALCQVRIVQNKTIKEDNCTGCIVLATHRNHSDREELDFDFKFTKEDM